MTTNRRAILRPPLLLFWALSAAVSATTCLESPTERMGKKFAAYVSALPELEPLPSDKTYVLLVDYVEDPNLPTLKPAALGDLFRRTEKYTQQYLGYRITLKLRRRIPIRAFFEEKAPVFKHPVLSYPISAWYLDPQDPQLTEKLMRVVPHALRKKSPELLERYFGKREADDETYFRRIVTEFRRKLNGIYGEKDASGKPLLDLSKKASAAETRRRKLYVSYAHWASISYQERDVDFFVTNTIMAGPDSGMPIYVINRGGVTSAFIENNAHRPLNGIGVMGLYPFLSQGPFFTGERGSMTRDEQLDAAALLLVHEFGHLLMRKKEVYDLEGSVHVAPRGLDYASWARGVKAAGDAKSKLVPAMKKF